MNQKIIEIKTSDCIKAISFDPTKNTLFLKFNESPFYAYNNVSVEVFNTLLNHPEKGRYFSKIKKSLGKPIRLDN